MPIDIVDETGREPGLAETAVKAADAILASIARPQAELSVLLVGDERMRELNRDWRDTDRPTDVLSFPQLDESLVPSGMTMLGDVVVSVDTMRRQAGEGGWTEEEELVRLLLHGVLHLVGFDHENDEDARTMRREEERVVRLLGERGIACAWEDES